MSRLMKGDDAPPFKIFDLSGTQVEVPLVDKWIFLSFHRFAACPFCVLRTHELIKAHDTFLKNNIEIISLWPSSTENMRRFIGSGNAPFALIADPEKKTYKKYGVTESSIIGFLKLLTRPQLMLNAIKHTYKNMNIDSDAALHPAEFLITPHGKIAIAYYGEHYGDHLPIEDIILKMRQGNFPNGDVQNKNDGQM